jgi:hypothetical protein
MTPPNPEQEHRAVIGTHIQRLIVLQDWEIYKAEVLEMAQRTLEGLATCPKEDVEAEQGKLKGIRAVLQLPQTLIAQGRR